MGRKRFRDSPFYKQNASLGRKRFRDGYGRHKQNAPTLGRKRFRDSPFYKQNAPLGRKRFRDSPFYKRNAPLGRKRFRDGYGRHKQNAPTLGRKKFCLMIYSLITLSFYFQKIPLQSERNARFMVSINKSPFHRGGAENDEETQRREGDDERIERKDRILPTFSSLSLPSPRLPSPSLFVSLRCLRVLCASAVKRALLAEFS